MSHKRLNIDQCLTLASSKCLEESKEATNKSSKLEMQEQKHEEKKTGTRMQMRKR